MKKKIPKKRSHVPPPGSAMGDIEYNREKFKKETEEIVEEEQEKSDADDNGSVGQEEKPSNQKREFKASDSG